METAHGLTALGKHTGYVQRTQMAVCDQIPDLCVWLASLPARRPALEGSGLGNRRLVQDYETEHGGVSAPRVTGLEALRHLLEEHKMSGADLSRLLGAHRTLGPMILRRERKLTVEHVRVLCRHFNVAADLFL